MDVAASPHSQATHASAPVPQPVGGPVPVAWREGTLTRARELEALCEWNSQKHAGEGDWALVEAVKCHLEAARQAARGAAARAAQVVPDLPQWAAYRAGNEQS